MAMVMAMAIGLIYAIKSARIALQINEINK